MIVWRFDSIRFMIPGLGLLFFQELVWFGLAMSGQCSLFGFFLFSVLAMARCSAEYRLWPSGVLDLVLLYGLILWLARWELRGNRELFFGLFFFLKFWRGNNIALYPRTGRNEEHGM